MQYIVKSITIGCFMYLISALETEEICHKRQILATKN